MVITVGIVCGGMGAYLLAMVGVLRKRDRCPACGERRLVLVALTRGATWPPKDRPADTSLHRCQACGHEACRAGDGPLIPKHAWDAGQRESTAIPTATVVKS
jgi:DNA-directed RNA polymerase subunit RPC12/RpoP